MNGVDSSSLTGPKGGIQRLIEINQKAQQDQIDIKSGLKAQVNALAELKKRVQALETSVESIDEESELLNRTTSWVQVDIPIVTATADAGTLEGEYDFEIVQLATKTERVGGTDIGDQLSQTTDVSGVTLSTMPVATAITTGFFTINGVRIEIYDPNDTPTEAVAVPTTGSLQDLFDAIGTATGSAVTASYNATADKVELASASEIFLGTASDTSNFLKVAKLTGNGTGTVTSESALGAVKIGSSIANANLKTTVTTPGSFKINGVSFSYDTSADSLDSIMKQINSSDANVQIVYDPVSDEFTLVSRDTGSLDLSVEDTTGNLLEAMGLNSSSTLNKGVNAQFKINSGSTITSTSNVLTGELHGVSGLSVTAKKVGTDTVTVAQDGSAVRAKIDDFINKFNDVQSYITSQTKITTQDTVDKNTGIKIQKVTPGPLTNNREVKALGRKLRELVFESTGSATGEYKRMPDIGIDFKKDSNELEVKDASLLDDVLDKQAIKVSKLFANSYESLAESSNNGFSINADIYLGNVLETDNTLFDQKTESLNSRIASVDEKINKLQTELEDTLKKLEQDISQVQQSEYNMNQQIKFINQRFFS